MKKSVCRIYFSKAVETSGNSDTAFILMMGRYSCLIKIYFLKECHENINSPDTKPLPNGLLIKTMPEL